MGFRRQARELALKMIFQNDVGGVALQDLIPQWLSGIKAAPEVLEYAETLTRGVVREQETLDRLISGQSHHWKLERIAPVDRNVLRLAVYELLHCGDVPRSVIIDEAVEIAKKYSTQESGGFVNGVLDQIKSPLPDGE